MTMRQPRQFWQDLVDEFDRSGEELKHFAHRRGILPQALRAWVGRLRKPASAGAAVRMIPVQIVPTSNSTNVPSQNATPSVELSWDEIVLRVSVGTGPQYVAQLLCEIRRHADVA